MCTCLNDSLSHTSCNGVALFSGLLSFTCSVRIRSKRTLPLASGAASSLIVERFELSAGRMRLASSFLAHLRQIQATTARLLPPPTRSLSLLWMRSESTTWQSPQWARRRAWIDSTGTTAESLACRADSLLLPSLPLRLARARERASFRATKRKLTNTFEETCLCNGNSNAHLWKRADSTRLDSVRLQRRSSERKRCRCIRLSLRAPSARTSARSLAVCVAAAAHFRRSLARSLARVIHTYDGQFVREYERRILRLLALTPFRDANTVSYKLDRSFARSLA